MEQNEADFVTILSSELIAEVMEEYFNRKMYRQRVKVVDLQPQGSGYAFSLVFAKNDIKDISTQDILDAVKAIPGPSTEDIMEEMVSVKRTRASNGTFTKKATT